MGLPHIVAKSTKGICLTHFSNFIDKIISLTTQREKTFCIMNNLPNETLVHIFSFVPMKDVVLGLSLTCHLFRDIIQDHPEKMTKYEKTTVKGQQTVHVKANVFGEVTVHKERLGFDTQHEKVERRLKGQMIGIWTKTLHECTKSTTYYYKAKRGRLGFLYSHKIKANGEEKIEQRLRGESIEYLHRPVMELECQGKTYPAFQRTKVFGVIGRSVEQKNLCKLLLRASWGHAEFINLSFCKKIKCCRSKQRVWHFLLMFFATV
ncbi:hypothetical protein GMAR_ORF280 [Golden Marseillevirus]|uniref:hypothetical protein n=1 Tax=Golden Marseillevirus TaxID=1720526 RepID=UPI000877A99C|nr:hypothetical protein GMAR_ORF280 [Golden Marseillevirus]ALX27654.1 hypothetical protein GMAR_ORF280 [Golden Marseillevirus]